MRKFCSALSATYRPLHFHEQGSITLIFIGAIALVCAVTSAVIWIMHLTVQTSDVPVFSNAVMVNAASTTPGGRDAVAQMFGAPVAATSAGGHEISGVRLQGIVSDKRGTGVALFSIDGAPPVRVRVGGLVRDGVTVEQIHARHVLLEHSGKRLELRLVARTPQPVSNVQHRNNPTALSDGPGMAGTGLPGGPPSPAPSTR